MLLAKLLLAALLLVFTLFLKSSGEDAVRHMQMDILRSCTSPEEEFERLYNYLKSASSGGKEIEDWKLNPSHLNRCGNRSDKVFQLKLTEDNYLDADGVFYPPDDFCANLKDSTSRICYPQQMVLNKCCPEDEIWDLDNNYCRMTPNRFRPKISSLESSVKYMNIRMPFISLSIKPGIRNQMLPVTNRTAPLVCPSGFDLKIYISELCSSMPPSSFLEELVTANGAILYGNNSVQCLHKIPFEICRFEITEDGIRYETASGLFHRKSDMNQLTHEHYCVEGYFSNPLCYDTRPTDNAILQQRCVQSLNEFLMFCEPSGALLQSEQNPEKAYCLASIWLSTCPLLLFAALAKFITSHKNVHSWTLSCYLLSMFFVNINSAILALETRELGCKVTDFSMKFLYLSTLCWLTSINFGLWRTFRSKLPKPVAPHYFLYNFLFSSMFPALIVTISYFGAQGNTCGSQYCVLYSHKTIPFYNFPVILLISINLLLFIRTSMIIAGLRKETSSVLHKEPSGRRQLESFRLFTKLFLMTGPIWVIRLVLFFLQIKGLYFTWYGVILEGIFSVPEAVFSIMVLLHPEFKKWAWQKYPNVSKKLSKIVPCFSYTPVVNIEMGSKSNLSTNTVNATGKSPTTSAR